MVYGLPNSLCFFQTMVTFHSWFQAEASFSMWLQWHHFCLYPLHLSYWCLASPVPEHCCAPAKALPKSFHVLSKLPQVLESHLGPPATRHCGHSHRTPRSIGAGCCSGDGQLEQPALPSLAGTAGECNPQHSCLLKQMCQKWLYSGLLTSYFFPQICYFCLTVFTVAILVNLWLLRVSGHAFLPSSPGKTIT